MIFKQLVDSETSTYTYLLADEKTKEAVIIDPVLEQVERDTNLIKELWLTLTHILDTHVHADHITWSGELRQKFPDSKIALWKENNLSCANLQLEQSDIISFWKHSLEVITNPWHTAGCVSFKLGSMIFTWDLLMIRTAWRTDFQAGSSEQMYHNIQEKIYTLPDDTIIYPWHDYNGFTSSTVWEEKKYNSLITQNTSLKDFSDAMNNLNLAYPKKIDISLPANKKCWE